MNGSGSQRLPPQRVPVEVVEFHPAASREGARGLLGWAQIRYGDLLVEAAVRRTLGGRYSLSFPRRESRGGRAYSQVRPLDAAARGHIEAVVIGELRRRGAVQ